MIRKAAVAGAFYPGDMEELDNMVTGFLSKVPEIKLEKEVKAIIVPHAGYIYSGGVAAYGYSLLKKKSKIILLGPSHFVSFNDVVSDVNEYWETPLGKVRVIDSNFVKSEEAHLREHCLEVQIPFLQKILDKFEILPLVTGEVDPRAVRKKILEMFDEDSFIVISSDLSHFYDDKTANLLDQNINKAIQNLDYEWILKEGEACGKTPILTLIDIAQNLNWKCKLLDYKNSGDVTGDKERVVGYSSFAFY